MNNTYTVKHIADLLGLSTNTVYKYLNAGIIRTTRPQNMKSRFRVSKKALEEYLGMSLEEYRAEKQHTAPPLSSQEDSEAVVSAPAAQDEPNVHSDAQKTAVVQPSPQETTEKTTVPLHPFHEYAHEHMREEHIPNLHDAPPSFALRTTRALLLVALIGVTLNLAFFQLPHPITLLSQLLILFVFLLLAYQYGGMQRKRIAI